MCVLSVVSSLARVAPSSPCLFALCATDHKRGACNASVHPPFTSFRLDARGFLKKGRAGNSKVPFHEPPVFVPQHAGPGLALALAVAVAVACVNIASVDALDL